MNQRLHGSKTIAASGDWPAPLRYKPAAADIDALIEAARRHPLGVDFLVHGHLGTVAVTFQTHAFTVVAARERLATR